MRIVVCAKKVLDPDAVNNYVLAGKLTIGADGKTPDVAAIERLINAYDEQAMEAALRIRDAGVECRITVVSIGPDQDDILKHCHAMGANDVEIVAIDADPSTLDCRGIATLLAAYLRHSDGADLILCGRQAPDDDQGVVPALLAEQLDMPLVPIAKAIEVGGSTLRITRSTPDGEEVVEGSAPAVVTITNELGTPRFPAAKQKMKARKVKPTVFSPEALGLGAEDLVPGTVLVRQFVPEVQGNCEFLEGTPAEVSRGLVDRLRADGII